MNFFYLYIFFFKFNRKNIKKKRYKLYITIFYSFCGNFKLNLTLFICKKILISITNTITINNYHKEYNKKPIKKNFTTY